jgi:hypothetical protein
MMRDYFLIRKRSIGRVVLRLSRFVRFFAIIGFAALLQSHRNPNQTPRRELAQKQASCTARILRKPSHGDSR